MVIATKTLGKFDNHSKLSLKRRVRLLVQRFSFFSKLIILILVCILLFTSHLRFVKEYIGENFYEFTGELGFRLDTVVIKGNKHIDTNFIVSTLNADVGTPLFSMQLDKIYSKLKNIPWVKDIAIRRKLPDTIIIHIEERSPIAIWQHQNKLYIIDFEGNIITDDKISDFVGLPHVVGVDAHLHAAALIEDLKSEPLIAENIIAAVRYGERRWNLILKQNITVKMPEKDFIIALKYLAKMHAKEKLFGQNYKIIDLRDPAKYYIEKI